MKPDIEAPRTVQVSITKRIRSAMIFGNAL